MFRRRVRRAHRRGMDGDAMVTPLSPESDRARFSDEELRLIWSALLYQAGACNENADLCHLAERVDAMLAENKQPLSPEPLDLSVFLDMLIGQCEDYGPKLTRDDWPSESLEWAENFRLIKTRLAEVESLRAALAQEIMSLAASRVAHERLRAALDRVCHLATERGKVKHVEPGAYIEHDGFSVQCPFCQGEVLKLRAALKEATHG